MNEGQKIPMTEGSGPVSSHVLQEHEPYNTHKDIQIKILDREKNWYRRGIKEAIYIKALKPEMNEDEGRHHIPPIYEAILPTKQEILDPRTTNGNGNGNCRVPVTSTL